VSDAAVGYIAETAYDSSLGARPIKRYINKQLTQRVAKMLLSSELKPGQTLQVEHDENGELSMTASNDPPHAEAIKK